MKILKTIHLFILVTFLLSMNNYDAMIQDSYPTYPEYSQLDLFEPTKLQSFDSIQDAYKKNQITKREYNSRMKNFAWSIYNFMKRNKDPLTLISPRIQQFCDHIETDPVNHRNAFKNYPYLKTLKNILKTNNEIIMSRVHAPMPLTQHFQNDADKQNAINAAMDGLLQDYGLLEAIKPETPDAISLILQEETLLLNYLQLAANVTYFAAATSTYIGINFALEQTPTELINIALENLFIFGNTTKLKTLACNFLAALENIAD